MASIKTKLVSLNLGIATLITAVLGLFLWMVASLSEDLSQARMSLPQMEATFTNLDNQVTEATLALWTLSFAANGHNLLERAKEVETVIGTMREDVNTLKDTMQDAPHQGGVVSLSNELLLLENRAQAITEARRALLNAKRIRGRSIPLLTEMLFEQATTEEERKNAAVLLVDLEQALHGKPAFRDALPERCQRLTGAQDSPPCRLLDEILNNLLHPRAAEDALRLAVGEVGNHLRSFRAILNASRTQIEDSRATALTSWSDRLTLLTTAMTVALVLAVPVLFFSQWIQEIQIIRRLEAMRNGMADWLKGRAPVIPVRGEDELDQMETYLTRFKETIERRDVVLKSTSEGLERARENLRTLLATVPTGILLIDLSERMILESNVAAERLLGIDTAETAHETIRRTLPTQEPWSDILTRVASGDRVENAEVTLMPGRGKVPQSDRNIANGPPTQSHPELGSAEGESSWLLVSARSIPFDGGLRALIGLADISRQKELEKELRDRAIRDPLTGLYNRRHFEALALQSMKRFRRNGEPLTVALMDIDHFKVINDTHGHVNGDRALRRLAEIIADTIREADTPGRLGGEEFGLLLPGVDLKGAHVFAERLRKAVAETSIRLPQDETLTLTVSLGIAQIRLEDTLESLVNRADMALYAAKHGGRNRVEDEKALLPLKDTPSEAQQ
ncbi:diguanylate cyclase [Rhodospirillum sp. A1_3_36]|uniref:sensor domain-containing diguanylate cyclase n=1 Tax=Rhodospirillum sp. A1_3_36 TaxID=3391666 RepID=UPI0039A4E57F